MNFYLFRRAYKKWALFFTFIFLINIPFLWSYYDYSFESEDELDYAYESGVINYEIYRDLKAEFDLLDEDEDKEERLDVSLKIENTVQSEDYVEKSDDIIGYSRINADINNKFKTGFLVMHKNDVISRYDSESKVFVYDKVEKKTNLEKYFLQFTPITPKNTKFITGNFRGRFGLGLTFAKTNSIKDGISGDLSLPYKRTIIYKNEVFKSYLKSSFLKGVGIEQKFENFKLTAVYSDAKNPVREVAVREDDGEIKLKTISEKDHEKIFASCLEYRYSSILKLGVVYYKLKNDYFFDDMQDVDKKGRGVYLNLKFKQFYYDQEISNVSSMTAFINKFGFDNKDNIKFNISYRNYPSDYANSLANSLSLHPNKTYFRCNDEKGIRAFFSYLHAKCLKLSLQSDIFVYNKRRLKNSETDEYEVLYYPNIMNKYNTAKLKYIYDKFYYQFGYKVYDRDVTVVSSTYHQRKDEYFSYKINYNDKIVDFYVQYSNRIKGTDIPDNRYTAEYLTLMFKLKLLKSSYLSSKINFKDYRLSDKFDDKFSYVFRLVSKLNKNYKLKFSWYCLDLIEDFTDEETELELYRKSIQDKWKLECDIMF